MARASTRHELFTQHAQHTRVQVLTGLHTPTHSLIEKHAAEDQRGVPRTSAAAKNTDTPVDTAADGEARVNEILTDGNQLQHLQKMGVMTALSIAIHNVPEGLATFVAALNDPLNAGTRCPQCFP